MAGISVSAGCMVMVYTVSDLWDLSKKYKALRYLASDINYEKELKDALQTNNIMIILEICEGKTKFFFENKGWYTLLMLTV